MPGIPCAPGRRAYLSVGREVGALCVERLAVFVPSLPHPLLSTVYQCDGCLSYLGRGGSWLGCQVWPAISAVCILELVANSGSSRMSRTPNLHSLRATKLFIVGKHYVLSEPDIGISSHIQIYSVALIIIIMIMIMMIFFY